MTPRRRGVAGRCLDWLGWLGLRAVLAAGTAWQENEQPNSLVAAPGTLVLARREGWSAIICQVE